MEQHLKIDFVSDIVCPWCAIGLGSLEQALASVAADGISADLHFEPFELNPMMPREGENQAEHIARKYGLTPAEVENNRVRLVARANEAGYTFNFSEGKRVYNTFDGHRLLHWAELEGRQLALKKALLTAYFTDQKNIDAHPVLIDTVIEAGLDVARARSILESDEYAQDVREREGLWRDRGINGVPAIIINDRHLIQGGQPADVFEAALRKIAQTPEPSEA